MKKTRKNIKYFRVTSLLDLNAADVYKHIQKLYAQIAKQKKIIKTLSLKITKMKFLSKLDAHMMKTQQEEVIQDKTDSVSNSNVAVPKKEEENVLDFINEIKNQAMMNTYEQAGFIYEPTSGLYWDSKSGYYWNPECDLYYNGNDGNWYKLNPITNEFTFHSATAAAKQVKKNEKEEEKAIRKILEEGRQPLKCQEKVSLCDEKSEKTSETRRKYNSSSENSDLSDDKRRRRRRKKSRSRSRSGSRKAKDKKSRSRSEEEETREDGELDDSSSNSTDSDYLREIEYREIKKRKKKRKGNEYEEIAKKYPPSLRLIVSESEIDSIQVGKLFVVTFKGGTLGREGDHHHVLLTTESVSKNHLEFSYNKKKDIYQFIDKSRNGTLLNGKQVSLLSKTECEPQNLHHGDILEIAHVKLLAHIHEGLQTCNECEPFNYVQQKPQEQTAKSSDDYVPNLSHKEQLKLLQKRYGLQAEKYQDSQPGTSNKSYEDRASQRRKKVGSSHDNEKTVQSSVDKSITSENKGFKLLSKMGWNTGESLGKSDGGIKEPVQLKTQKNKIGLGHESSSSSSVVLEAGSNKKKHEIWSKTQERYNKLKEDKN